jgi:hypothetical protein
MKVHGSGKQRAVRRALTAALGELTTTDAASAGATATDASLIRDMTRGGLQIPKAAYAEWVQHLAAAVKVLLTVSNLCSRGKSLAAWVQHTILASYLADEWHTSVCSHLQDAPALRLLLLVLIVHAVVKALVGSFLENEVAELVNPSGSTITFRQALQTTKRKALAATTSTAKRPRTAGGAPASSAPTAASSADVSAAAAAAAPATDDADVSMAVPPAMPNASDVGAPRAHTRKGPLAARVVPAAVTDLDISNVSIATTATASSTRQRGPKAAYRQNEAAMRTSAFPAATTTAPRPSALSGGGRAAAPAEPSTRKIVRPQGTGRGRTRP